MLGNDKEILLSYLSNTSKFTAVGCRSGTAAARENQIGSAIFKFRWRNNGRFPFGKSLYDQLFGMSIFRL